MQTLQTLPNHSKSFLKIAYINNFELLSSKNKSNTKAKSKSDSKDDSKSDKKWKKDLKKVSKNKNSDRLTSKDCIYEQSSMFLYAIPK